MSFLNLSKFVKRFFVFDLDDKRAIMYFNSASSTDKPNDVIPLGSLLAVRREDQSSGAKELPINQTNNLASSTSIRDQSYAQGPETTIAKRSSMDPSNRRSRSI